MLTRWITPALGAVSRRIYFALDGRTLTLSFLSLQALQAVVLCFRPRTTSSVELVRLVGRPGAGARGRGEDDDDFESDI
jgi:hypothetical protein